MNNLYFRCFHLYNINVKKRKEDINSMKITMIQKTIWRSKSINIPPKVKKPKKQKTDFSKYLKEESIKAGLNPAEVLSFYKNRR